MRFTFPRCAMLSAVAAAISFPEPIPYGLAAAGGVASVECSATEVSAKSRGAGRDDTAGSGAVAAVSLFSRYIGPWSSSSQSGLTAGKRRRIFCTKSKLGLFRPDKIWDIPDGWIPSSSARRLDVSPSLRIKLSNFSRITDVFTKITLFSFVNKPPLYKCNYKHCD